MRRLITALILLGIAPTIVSAASTAEQTLYWWQDELRCVAAALGQARTGQVAEWPRMTVATGTATLPLPRMSGGIAMDGRIDEPAWQQATRLGVGPLFDDWTAGPFSIDVYCCRDDQQLYLAIQSPRDLRELQSLAEEAELFAVNDQPYRLSGTKKTAGPVVSADGRTLELVLPLPKTITLTFAVELLRRSAGQLPAAARSLGLDRVKEAQPQRRPHFRGPELWLKPIVVRLVPADAAVHLVFSASALDWQTSEKGQPSGLGSVPIRSSAENGLALVDWKPEGGKRPWTFQSFTYQEPIAAQLSAIRELAARSKVPTACPSAAEIAALEGKLRQADLSPSADRAAWRALFCAARELRSRAQLSLLDAPLLFVKRHPYHSGHIYDDFYTWHPGGGMYVLPRPDRMESDRGIRAVIDAHTAESLGDGVYRDPELSWDARRIVFAAKTQDKGVTSLYEIGVDGRGLRRLTTGDEHSDIQPAYLPDDRIVFISTRPKALVPCFNSGVGTLHTMNADGSNLRAISANNVTEFDPAILSDGRILYGRWEYVDKTALYMQSLWTVSPDGRMEESLFKNNMPKPTAVLDARPVPGSHRVVASLTPHNGQSVGTIATIDPRYGKNSLDAVVNFTPEYPVRMDQGLASGPCDPWPLSDDDLIMATNAIGGHGILELVDRWGRRELVHADPEISLFEPMLVKPRPRPPVISPREESQKSGRFLVTDVYQGLEGVARGTIKRLRLIEETARTSGIPPGGRWWNQAFLVSWQGAYIVKNILGTVPVEPDGSAYFEAPAGRAVYFEALDAQGREVQRMRTFVQAAPGVTRSCIGCHEHKLSAPPRAAQAPLAGFRGPSQPEPEAWGSGLLDYASMVQPVLDRRCVECHGGEKGMAGGVDLSGGWTWAFNISYETLIKRRWVGFLNCNNASVHTSELLRPRAIGSGAAPLADLLLSGHDGQIPDLTAEERSLLLAWMDTNSNYYGSWDYSAQATCEAILALQAPLEHEMQKAGCTDCHARRHIGNDWVNLQTPERSRILRAPLAKGGVGLGLAMCRSRKSAEGYPLVTQRVQPPDVLLPSKEPVRDTSGTPQISFASIEDPHYQALLAAIRRARGDALAKARVDMPGAQIVGGECRMQVPPPLPEAPPKLHARVIDAGVVELWWPRSALTVGLQYELHRGPAADFTPLADTQIALTTAGRFTDFDAQAGKQHYALVVTSARQRSKPVRLTLDVPALPPPVAPAHVIAQATPGELFLVWTPESGNARFDVYRADGGAEQFAKITPQPLTATEFSDGEIQPGHSYQYRVVAFDRRGQASPPSASIEVVASAKVSAPLLSLPLATDVQAQLFDGSPLAGTLAGDAKIECQALNLGKAGFVSFEHRKEFDLGTAFSVECRVWLDEGNKMPVVIGCGTFNHTGWFLQRFGRGWRWHVGGVSCDGGQPVLGRWTHLAATFNGRQATLLQDGQQVAQVDCDPKRAPWSGPLLIGQYASQGPAYQLHGQIKDVRLYRRVLTGAEFQKETLGQAGGETR